MRWSDSYKAIHKYIRVHRGSASGYQCYFCGAPAKHWACIGEKTHVDTRYGERLSYSINLDDYAPACVTCNRYLDIGSVSLTCSKGHYNNWRVRPSNGKRACRSCEALAQKKYRQGLDTTDAVV